MGDVAEVPFKATKAQRPYQPFGGAKRLIECREPEVVLYGCAGGGKTIACLNKLYLVCNKYPGVRCLIVRKTRESLSEAALVTWEQKVVPEGHPMLAGPQRRMRQLYDFGNGSQIVVGGLDKSQKVMSTEYDLIYCLVGESRVESPSRIERGFERRYSGPLVTIRTATGNELTGTPNHPILTDKGWVALGRLREGDYVISRRTGERVGFGDPDVGQEPTPIADVVRAMALASPLGSKWVETVPMDFHGDGTNGYVHIVPAAGFLQGGGDPAGGEQFLEGDGGRGHLEQGVLVGEGAAFELLLGGDASSVRRPVTPTEFPHPLAVGFRPAPGFCRSRPGSGEVGLPDDIGSHLGLSVGKSLVERLPRDAATGHLLFQSRDADVDGRRDGQKTPLPGEVAADCVINVSVTDAGAGRHVYNLQTEDSWYYANNIVTHNCQEAIEVTEEDWENLTTRLRNNRMPYQQLIADTNPSSQMHWLKKRIDNEKTRGLESLLEDNPEYFDQKTGLITPKGKVYISKLDALTGVRKARLRYGLWKQAEGGIYEMWDENVHVVDAFPVPPDWSRYWSVDFGFTNPMVVQLWAEDPDGRLYLYKEFYRSKTLVEDVAVEMKKMLADDLEACRQYVFSSLPNGEITPEAAQLLDEIPQMIKPKALTCDHDAEDRATLERHLGMQTRAASKAVLAGIQVVSERLKVQPDGKPRLMMFRNARYHAPDEHLVDAKRPTCTREEMDGYIWADSKTKESPVKENDHGNDSLRYQCVYLNKKSDFFFASIPM